MGRVVVLIGLVLSLVFHAVAMMRDPGGDSTSYRSNGGGYGSGSGGGFGGGHK